MTPTEILDEAKRRFIVLYHDNPDDLERLLRQALGKYQDKAGMILEVWSDSPSFSIPAHFHAVAGCCDAKRRHMSWRMGEMDAEETIPAVFDEETGDMVTPEETVTVQKPAIVVQVGSKHEAPYCLYYFLDLRHWPADTPIPGDCDALLLDYLEALIAVLNTQRQREAYIMAGMSQPAQELISASELKQRVTELEMMMEDNKALVPPHSRF